MEGTGPGAVGRLDQSVDRQTGVQSIDRLARILRCFSARRPTLRITDISRETGLSTSTTHRLLSAMQRNGLVRQTADRRYTPGPLLVQLVRGGAASTSLRDAAFPTMTALRDAEEETVGLHALLSGDERVVVDQVESHHPLRRTYTELGVPIPLPYGAPGKTLLAFLARDRREAVLAWPIRQITPATVTNVDMLRSQLDEIRRQTFALSFAERTPGIHTVAAPIFDHTGSVMGALSLSGPEMRLSPDRMHDLAPRVRDAAWAISEILGSSLDMVRAQSTTGRG